VNAWAVEKSDYTAIFLRCTSLHHRKV